MIERRIGEPASAGRLLQRARPPLRTTPPQPHKRRAASAVIIRKRYVLCSRPRCIYKPPRCFVGLVAGVEDGCATFSEHRPRTIGFCARFWLMWCRIMSRMALLSDALVIVSLPPQGLECGEGYLSRGYCHGQRHVREIRAGLGHVGSGSSAGVSSHCAMRRRDRRMGRAEPRFPQNGVCRCCGGQCLCGGARVRAGRRDGAFSRPS